MDEQAAPQKESWLLALRNFLLHPREALALLGKDRYRSLKVRLFFSIGLLAGVPLLFITLVGALWLKDLLEEDFNKQLRWQIENSQQSIEFFLKEKISGLRYLVSVFSFQQLSEQVIIQNIYTKRKKEFPEIIDLGVIDSSGVQRAYAGPYDLVGKDYSGQEWFQKVIARGVYVSDVFTGYRKTPHFVIAVKYEAPERKKAWIIRATFDVDALTAFLSSIKLNERDDAFLLNTEGVLQTQSRFHGRILERASLPVIPPKQAYSVMKMAGEKGILGYTSIKESPWILGVVIESTAYSRLAEILKKQIVVLYVAIVLVVIGIVMNLRTVRNVVHWIEEADRKREEAIAQTEHSAKLASIGRLAAGVAHEINNPLAIINEKAGLMNDLLLMMGDKSCQDKFSPLIKGITDSVSRCRTITQRLLGFARRMEVSVGPIDLNETIKEVIGFLDREILYRSIKLELNLSEFLPVIESDRGQLQQVFLNIINNAIDAVKDGGLITVSTVPDGSFVRVMIRDNGHGIPREVLKHIFEPFYTTKEKGKGTGLGLSLSYGIIQRLGGGIQVDSVPNKGTTFTVKLPVKAVAGGDQS